ncbi:type II toxin-antitoxin system RelE/ParE family toxin [Candidatus Margulisiibacteriota bacterium]
MKKQLIIYQDNNGKEPFVEWLESIKDKTIKARIYTRLDRLETENYGECKNLGKGLYELKLKFGKGYRIYFAEEKMIILLLLGGDKSLQDKDIQKARKLLQKYKENNK